MSDAPPADPARPLLFQPFRIRGLTLKNRLVVPPMVHYRADPGATCGMFHQVHLGRYALGGFGLVFVEATGVEADTFADERDLGSSFITPAQIDEPRRARARASDDVNGRIVLLEKLVTHNDAGGRPVGVRDG